MVAQIKRKTQELYTYADYASWGEDAPRCELIDGVIYMMAAPSRIHQQISGRLFNILFSFLRGKTCEVYAAPFDVRLNYDTADDIVVQPDILVVCDMNKLENGKHCLGVPDFVIEILSPSSNMYDTGLKLKKYLDAKVRECWIIDPYSKKITAYRLVNGYYTTTTYLEGSIPVSVLEDCQISFEEVFYQ